MEAATAAEKRLRLRGAYAHYDEKGDVLYIHMGDHEARDSMEIEDGVVVDLDEDKNPVGLTIINLRQKIRTAKPQP